MAGTVLYHYLDPVFILLGRVVIATDNHGKSQLYGLWSWTWRLVNSFT